MISRSLSFSPPPYPSSRKKYATKKNNKNTQHYAKEKAKVVISSSTAEGLAAAKESILKAVSGADIVCIPADMSVKASVESLAQEVTEKHGGVDCLVNNAGVYVKGNATEGDPDEWAKMMEVNVNAPMRLTRRLSEGMIAKKSGVIINIGSIAAVEQMSGTSAAYSASKHAMWGWSRSLYTSLRHENIKVMTVNPAFVNTDMVGVEACRERMIQPEDIASVCMLPFTLSSGCVPEEITLRLALTPFVKK